MHDTLLNNSCYNTVLMTKHLTFRFEFHFFFFLFFFFWGGGGMVVVGGGRRWGGGGEGEVRLYKFCHSYLERTV